MPSKITVRSHHMSIRIAKITVVTTGNAGEETEKLDHIHIVRGGVR